MSANTTEHRPGRPAEREHRLHIPQPEATDALPKKQRRRKGAKAAYTHATPYEGVDTTPPPKAQKARKHKKPWVMGGVDGMGWLTNLPVTYRQLDKVLRENNARIDPYAPRNPMFRQAWYLRKHDGQRKLLLDKVDFLARVLASDTNGPYTVVYVGSTPGHHLKLLNWLFPMIQKWVLVDPKLESGHFGKVEHREGAQRDVFYYVTGDTVSDEDLLLQVYKKHGEKADLHIPNFVTAHNHVVQTVECHQTPLTSKYVDQLRQAGGAIILISDIHMPMAKRATEADIEQAAWDDMGHQKLLYETIQPVAASLVFRPPYGQKYKYLAGDLFLPAWGGCNSAACRLVIGQYTRSIETYDCARFEDVMHYFNQYVREPIRYEALREMGIVDLFKKVNEAFERHSDTETAITRLLHHDSISISDIFTGVLRDKHKQGDQFDPEAAPRRGVVRDPGVPENLPMPHRPNRQPRYPRGKSREQGKPQGPRQSTSQGPGRGESFQGRSRSRGESKSRGKSKSPQGPGQGKASQGPRPGTPQPGSKHQDPKHQGTPQPGSKQNTPHQGPKHQGSKHGKGRRQSQSQGRGEPQDPRQDRVTLHGEFHPQLIRGA